MSKVALTKNTKLTGNQSLNSLFSLPARKIPIAKSTIILSKAIDKIKGKFGYNGPSKVLLIVIID